MAKGETDYQYYAHLARQIREGNETAFAELYEHTYPAFYRYVYYFLKDQDVISDALQEIYISIYKNISHLKMDRLLYSWAKQIAYHVCCDFAQKMKNEREGLVRLSDDDVIDRLAVRSEGDEFQQVYDRDTAAQVRQALADLPVATRQAFLLRYENGLKLEEIADFMNISLATTKRYILSARKALQERLAHLQNQV